MQVFQYNEKRAPVDQALNYSLEDPKNACPQFGAIDVILYWRQGLIGEQRRTNVRQLYPLASRKDVERRTSDLAEQRTEGVTDNAVRNTLFGRVRGTRSDRPSASHSVADGRLRQSGFPYAARARQEDRAAGSRRGDFGDAGTKAPNLPVATGEWQLMKRD